MTLFLKDNSIAFKETEAQDINNVLIDHFDILCFNVASITSVLGTINNKTIDHKLIAGVRDYINVSCKKSSKKKGGSMPGDYYGYENGVYSAGNENMGTNTGTVDFDAGIQRAGLVSQMGGGRIVYDSSMKKRVKSILDSHSLHVKNVVFKELMGIINDNLLCLITELKSSAPVTVQKINTIMAKKQFAVFK